MGKPASKRIRVKIAKHLPLGLAVELDEDSHGIIRVREISWDQEKRLNWKQHYPVGSEAWAIPIQMEDGHPSELSLRLVENDPWEDISSYFRKHKTYEGIVTGVVGYGAFVELMPGVTGLLHQSKFPSWVQKTPVDLFWPGDRVRVVVEEIDIRKRRMGLGLQADIKPAIKSKLGQAQSSKNTNSDNEHNQAEIDKFIRDKHNRYSILLVEDNREQSKLASNWLKGVGQKVNVVSHAEEALATASNLLPDIVFIDVDLPDMDGFALAKQLLDAHPHIQLVITTDYASADERIEELDSLLERGVEFLPKPLIPDDLLDFLKKNGRRNKTSPALKEISSEGNLFDVGNSTTRSLRMLLQKGRVRLGFEAAILFRLDAAQRTVSIVESAAQSSLNSYAVPSLIYSPVRDIAEDEEIVSIEKCEKEDEARFQYLLDLFPLQACIGVPVPVNLPQKYALLFLNSQTKEIYEDDLIFAEAVALVAGSYLEQNLFHEKSILIQRSALIGQLSRAMIHEINNMMGPLNSRLVLLKKKLDNFKKGGTSVEKTIAITNKIGEVQKPIQKIVTTMQMLGRIITKDKDEILRLDEIINETINLIRDIADRDHVTLSFTPPEKLLLIRSQAAALQQILLNLLLNAIQQITELRSQNDGLVQIIIETDVSSSNENLLRILIKDNGPGIHTSLWETVFELGYSTRQDGSGIGLYISKSLAEEKLGGQLFVQESYILGGTTVALEIPHHI
jgi:signal transduction histidine kinase/predicted RNA-binding protein with RPS1 domain